MSAIVKQTFSGRRPRRATGAGRKRRLMRGCRFHTVACEFCRTQVTRGDRKIARKGRLFWGSRNVCRPHDNQLRTRGAIVYREERVVNTLPELTEVETTDVSRGLSWPTVQEIREAEILSEW